MPTSGNPASSARVPEEEEAHLGGPSFLHRDHLVDGDVAAQRVERRLTDEAARQHQAVDALGLESTRHRDGVVELEAACEAVGQVHLGGDGEAPTDARAHGAQDLDGEPRAIFD